MKRTIVRHMPDGTEVREERHEYRIFTIFWVTVGWLMIIGGTVSLGWWSIPLWLGIIGVVALLRWGGGKK